MLRFGEDEYSQMMMELEGSLIGLKDWRLVFSAEETLRLEMLKGVDSTNSPDFLQAKGKGIEGRLKGGLGRREGRLLNWS